MNITLWVFQGLAALAFVYSGWLKAFQHDKAKASWGWAKDVPKGLVVFIGLAELLGAIGLIVPQALNVAPVLAPIAATALAAVVLFGAVLHLTRKEYREIGVNAVFILLAAVVAIGRFL
ncbi:DoxX-like family protein [Paenibacillus catalpae]|uniref:DoxX-like family protein n=1 Tax=Paenibacillus catalpae TaxID=1045775 RepID=A0A1I2GL45_9BACL|nr:DoxX family protein [Paenibacillus catalpae]SFF17311.1 DoxX-like family protein [Paenibacillus catalpae]